jgi:hypothetical protein
MVNKAIYYAAAGTTAIAGILHLMIAPNVIDFNLNTGIFFIVAGIAQLFWAVPTARRWGRPWYYAGIGGTAVLITMWVVTRMPDNPITGRAGPVNEMGIAIEILQGAFIGLLVAILASGSKTVKKEAK